MPALLFYLLGFCHLQGQVTGRVTDEWMNEVVRICRNDFVRTAIEVCGHVYMGRRNSLKPENPFVSSEPAAEIVPSSTKKDAENANTMMESIPNSPQELTATLFEKQPSKLYLQYIPTLKKSNVSFEEFKKIIQNIQRGVEDSSASESNTSSRKKRQFFDNLPEECCKYGCRRHYLLMYC
ncbi:relaxin-like protein SQ10 [Lepus europaeus]|uniref:relaxin-like protein SQ10 n=1 Tax=Lepus europaeus TaxID=9983 RepID=UPI002B48AFA2|nr:relaxin-like protein SQ10 [Lepus europaeus]